MTELGWGFIGAGIWATTRMIPAVQAVEGARGVGVFSTDRDRGARVAREFELDRAYQSLDELLADPAVDAVYVGTTNDLHAPQTIAAARAGKHVLCEKPVALSVEDGFAIRNAGSDAGVVLAVNHHLRGAPTIIAMRELLRDGAIGELVAARIFHARSLPPAMRTWRLNRPDAGAGVILDITVHDADVIRFLLDDEIVEVTALASNEGLAEGTVEDSVMGAMRTSRGPLLCFHDAFTVPHAGTGVELHGTDGSLFGRDVLMPDPVGDVLLRRLDEIAPIPIKARWPLYEYAIRRFCEATRGDSQPLASIDDGIAALAVAIAARESAAQRRPVVPAPWAERTADP
jgi:1,5-anhydro-D-fructose reductase (1,5-anhydro-D-mannitol-forming)